MKNNIFGSRLRELRKDKKLTAKKFGEKFGLAESTISGYENGNRTPDAELIRKFADFFDVSIDYLLGRTDEPNPIGTQEVSERTKKLGLRLKQARIQKDLTQNDAASVVGISNVVLSHYETGDRKPDPETLLKLADLYGVSIDWLYGRTDNPKEIVINNIAFHRSDDPIKDLPPEAWEELQNYLDYLAHKYRPVKKEEKEKEKE